MDLQPDASPVVVVTRDPELLDRVLSVTAALDVEPEVVPDAGALRGRWHAAPLVLVGVDQAASVAALVLPRRTDLYLLGDDELPEDAVAWSARLGAVVLTLPSGADALTAAVAASDGHRGGRGRVVCLVGGSGGVGSSTCATGLAVTAAGLNRRVVLVDADERSGGLDLLLGAEQTAGWRWPRLTGARGHLGDLRGQLPAAAGVDVLAMAREPQPASPLPADQLAAVLLSLQRSHELVVVDLPRLLGVAAREVLRTADLTLLVVRADLRGVAAAREVAHELVPACGPLAVLVRESRLRGLDAEAAAAAVGLPLLGTVPHDDSLVLAAERGDPPARAARSSLAKLSRQVLSELEPVGAPA
ncbi:septum site-determining protein Ssd [uncultured Friedmanniella sp.]|uniref:septum site-determining protein Ssd n=1 Tax=uncultured Friedmanniella sp. TaxID=335381 RepID=UPI0035CC3E51